MKRRGSAHALFVSRPSLPYFLSCAATTSRPWTSPTSFTVTGFFSSAVIAARLGCENAPEITLGARVLTVSSVRGRARRRARPGKKLGKRVGVVGWTAGAGPLHQARTRLTPLERRTGSQGTRHVPARADDRRGCVFSAISPTRAPNAALPRCRRRALFTIDDALSDAVFRLRLRHRPALVGHCGLCTCVARSVVAIPASRETLGRPGEPRRAYIILSYNTFVSSYESITFVRS